MDKVCTVRNVNSYVFFCKKVIGRSITGTWVKCALLEMLTAMFFFSKKVIGRSITGTWVKCALLENVDSYVFFSQIMVVWRVTCVYYFRSIIFLNLSCFGIFCLI
jgi:hypothetical protein